MLPPGVYTYIVLVYIMIRGNPITTARVSFLVTFSTPLGLEQRGLCLGPYRLMADPIRAYPTYGDPAIEDTLLAINDARACFFV